LTNASSVCSDNCDHLMGLRLRVCLLLSEVKVTLVLNFKHVLSSMFKLDYHTLFTSSFFTIVGSRWYYLIVSIGMLRIDPVSHFLYI